MAVDVTPNPSTPLPPTSDHKVAESEKVLNIHGLEDAKDPGSACSEKCTLILTQSHYAKDLAMYGLLSSIGSSVGALDKYGVFPLIRMLPNVRRLSEKNLRKNINIQKIMDILGLEFGKIYEDAKELRYGRLMIMANQNDHGLHIIGLLINFLNHFWPSLLKVPNFLCELRIPIVYCYSNETGEVLWFHTIPDYEAWKEGLRNKAPEYIIRFRVLETLTTAEAKIVFTHLDEHIRVFDWVNDEDDEAIEHAFSQNIEKIIDWLRATQVWL